ncbi:MAG: alpha/beta hydrolase [Candidatus Dadabacteria bacterium]|nr:alpha/beta hydrolase [Candidatus Dadabacteria bacterium]NIV42533.1 alpha/beta fold hydrolase [Candidatus Dadabacteria bacterium]NIX16375.1 alpha/beta fold hydrolase [Candidatus Dadabacteria bacterium]
MPSIEINGNEIFYLSNDKIDSTKPTLLFLHGAGQSHLTWEYQLEYLEGLDGYNFVIPDLPGHGKSDGEGLKSVSEYTEFIKSFINTLGLSELIFIGHSMGGAVAQLFALERPEYLKALILACTGASMSVARETLLAVRDNYEVFCEVAPTRAFAESSPEILKAKFKEGLQSTKQKVAYEDLLACNVFNISDKITEINISTLIIAGSEDILTLPRNSEFLNHQIFDSELHIVVGSGHFVMQEKPDEFNALISEFIKSL